MSLPGRKPQPAAAHLPQQMHFHLPDLCSIHALLPLILVGALLAVALALASSVLPFFNWNVFSLLATEILWIVLLGAAALCRLRPLMVRVSAPQGAMICFLALLVIIMLVAGAGQYLLKGLELGHYPVLWQVLQHVAVGGILAGLVLHYFYIQQQLYLEQQQQVETRMMARFQALQSRIRPHFLFNSMNIIASLIGSDPDKAEQVVEDMSALFRASLSDAEDLVPLAQELDLCERYVHIEQLRLGERLHINWQQKLRTTKHVVPSLCLQPLLENAIYHGIQPRVEGGTVDVLIDDHDACLRVTVSNPCDATQTVSRRQHGNGMALDNLEQRLRARYGTTAQFAVLRDEQRFTVSFMLPVARELAEEQPQ